MMTSPYNWTNNREEDDSAFHEYSNSHEYSSSYMQNKSGSADDSCHSSPCPDYEEVDTAAAVARARGLVYNLASEGIFQCSKKEEGINLEGDPVFKAKIMRSIVYCIHKDAGCKWSGELAKLKAHLNACLKDAVSCPSSCGAKISRLMMEDHMLYTCKARLVSCIHCKRDYPGSTIEDHQLSCGFELVHCENKCGQKIQRNRLKAHQINTCSKRLVGCQYCARNFTADTLQGHHRKCPAFPVPCPNRCEEESVPRDEVEKHLKECNSKKAKQQCSFREAGCPFESSSSMDQHMSEAVKLHLDLMCKLAARQREHIGRLTGQLERSHTSYNGVLLWKIKDFAAKLAEAKSSEGLELVSMPFFTSSQCGYKLQASLFLNGNGAGEASHMSAYIKILPGEHDGVLKWPFRHTVSFSLLDQNEERQSACNVVESFIPDPAWPNFQRPSREPDQLGFGFPKFVSHEVLLGVDRQFVRDDAIFVKIRVDPCRNVAV